MWWHELFSAICEIKRETKTYPQSFTVQNYDSQKLSCSLHEKTDSWRDRQKTSVVETRDSKIKFQREIYLGIIDILIILSLMSASVRKPDNRFFLNFFPRLLCYVADYSEILCRVFVELSYGASFLIEKQRRKEKWSLSKKAQCPIHWPQVLRRKWVKRNINRGSQLYKIPAFRMLA